MQYITAETAWGVGDVIVAAVTAAAAAVMVMAVAVAIVHGREQSATGQDPVRGRR